MNIKKGDTVVIIAGKDKGKSGKVIEAIPSKDKVVVEGVNLQTKHQKQTAKVQQGGIIHIPGPIHVSNVMLYDAKAKSGTRVRFQGQGRDKVRVSVKSGSVIE